MREGTIGWLAREGGVGVETVRYYQRRGLLPTPPRVGGSGLGGSVRRYDAADARRLGFIRSAQRAGFRLEEIRELLDLDARQDAARAQELATSRIAALDAEISELTRARDALRRLAAACSGEAGTCCPIIAAFDGEPASVTG